jgi:hypothetical protein
MMTILLALAAGSAVHATTYSGGGRVKFEGSSTLHDFSGEAPLDQLLARLEISSDGNSGTIEAEGAVSIAKMDTRNNGRDKKMRAMFEAEEWPLISGKISKSPVRIDRLSRTAPPQSTEPQEAADSKSTDQPLKLALTIRDKTVELPLKVWGFRELADGSVSCSMSCEISLEAFGLEAPTVLGLIRVADLVQVHGEFLLRPLDESGALLESNSALNQTNPR